MQKEFYKFKIGAFECIAVNDGGLNYPLEVFFSNAPIEEVKASLRQQGLTKEHIHTPYTCLFINTGQNQIMIDTGAGDIAMDARNFFPTIDNTNARSGKLAENLQAAGIELDQVDTVIITHAHPDHIAGTLTGGGELVFKHAKYFVARAEHAYWMSAEAEGLSSPSMVETARRYLAPLKSRLILLDGEIEILPGITILPAPGHTPGHIVIEVSSFGEKLLHIADTALTPLHLEHPGWQPLYDINPEDALRSKRQIFDWAAEAKALVFGHHFPPFPALGYVGKREAGWHWVPVERV